MYQYSLRTNPEERSSASPVVYVFLSNNTRQQNLTFFLGPRTSIGEFSSTFYAEFRYVYRVFLSGRVSKIQRNLNV